MSEVSYALEAKRRARFVKGLVDSNPVPRQIVVFYLGVWMVPILSAYAAMGLALRLTHNLVREAR